MKIWGALAAVVLAAGFGLTGCTQNPLGSAPGPSPLATKIGRAHV